MNLKKRIRAAAVAASLAAAFTLNAAALSLTYDGLDYSGIIYLKDDTAYVGARALSEAASAEAVSAEWDGSAAKIASTAARFEVEAGSTRLFSGGTFTEMPGAAELRDGRICIPVRALAQALGAEVAWNAASSHITLTTVAGSDTAFNTYSADELDVMSRIISAESCDEPYAGKLMVGNVIMNRVRSAEFPSTVREVVYDRRNGIQFTPVANGTINNTPCDECIQAAKAVLSGRARTLSALYFVNTDAAPNSWAERNRPFLAKIGSHSFFT